MNKGGFSWKKLSGLSGVKSNLSKKIGIMNQNYTIPIL